MKCPNCNQTIIDNKVFCTNCGTKLKNEKASFLSSKKIFLILIVSMLGLGFGTMYIIANVGIKPDLDYTTTIVKSNIKDFYDSYIIKDVIFTEKSSKDLENIKESLIGFEMELNREKFKIGLFQTKWAKLDKPIITEIEDLTKYKEQLQLNDEKAIGIKIEESSSGKESDESHNFEMISVGERLFLYYVDTYFELKPSTLGFKSTDTYYKVKLFTDEYPTNINERTRRINSKTKSDVENEIFDIYIKYFEEYEDNDIIHLVVREDTGYINSGMVSNIETISFDKSTGVEYNLKQYIEYIGKDYEEIITKYKINSEIVYNNSIEGVTSKYVLNPDLTYYVKDKKIYIACGQDQWGMLFAEVGL